MSEAEFAEAVEAATPQLPEGDYAIVEMMGHRTLVGRMAEVEQFGTKFLALEVAFNGGLLPAIMIGGASIYCLTPCSAETAAKKMATRLYLLPSGMASIVPPALMPPEPERSYGSSLDEEDDGITF